MFGRRKKTFGSKHSRRSAKRREDAWSSSVVGTHAAHSASRRQATSRRRSSSQSGNATSNQIDRIHFQSRSVDERTASRFRPGRSRTATFMRRKDRMHYILVVVVAIVVVAVALGLGTWAFRNSVSSSMALDDESVSEALVEVSSEDDPFYILLAGISDTDPAGETASYLAVMRVDVSNSTISLLNIPSAISQTYEDSTSADMLRDAPYATSEGDLVTRVSELIDQDINHYVRVTDEDFVDLVDVLGGLDVDVGILVDDPTVGTSVLEPGEQTLDGAQALTYVSAKNYVGGFGTRASVQNQLIQALIQKIQDKGGISFFMDADAIAGKIKTDMDYDTLNSIASIYDDATIYVETLPGSNTRSGDSVYWSLDSTYSSVLEEFKAGEDMDVSLDTSGVDKSSVSIIVLNGVGTDGLGAEVAEALTEDGFTIEDTGNAGSFVYDETLVIYEDEDDLLAAEAIVQSLGVGRTVAAGAYYSLTTDIQVVVGKDWIS